MRELIKKISWEKAMFYGTMLVLILVTLVKGYLSHGESIRTMLINDDFDTLMDFYNSVQYGFKPYAAKVIYPPLINAFYGFVGRFMVKNSPSLTLRVDQMGSLVFGMYIIVVYSSFIYCLNKIKKGLRFERVIFIIVMLFSLPFLFLYDRANSVILAVEALLVFCLYQNSGITKLRLVSFVALGIAAGIKIAPAIYGAILIREKRYKDALCAFIIGLIIFMVPFVLTDGNPVIMLNNIINTTGMMSGNSFDNFSGVYRITGHGVHVNLLNTSAFFSRLYDKNFFNIAQILNSFILFMGVFLAICATKMEYWKSVCILTCIIIIFPGFSAVYNLIYMVIPLILFLNSNPQKTKLNFLYLLLFIMLFMPVVNFQIPAFKIFLNDWHPLTLTTALESISLLALTILLLLDGCHSIYEIQFKQLNLIRKIESCCCFFVIILGIYFWKGGAFCRPVESFYPNNWQVINAQQGLSMKKGIYVWENRNMKIVLKADKILEKGLLIKLLNEESLTKSVSNKDKINVYVNDFLLVSQQEMGINSSCIYIEPNKLKDVINGKEAMIKLEKVNCDVTQPICIDYIGPSDFLERVASMAFVKRDTEGINVFGDNSLWMNSDAKVFLDSKRIVKYGLLIAIQAPIQLLETNKNKQLILNVSIGNKLLKQVIVNDTEVKTIAVSPYDIENALKMEKDLQTIEIKLSINGIFNSEKMGLDEISQNRSLRIHYIGPCAELPLMHWKEFDKNTKLFINPEVLDNSDLYVVYKILNNKFVARNTVELAAKIDSKIVYEKSLSELEYNNLNIMRIPFNVFSMKDRIAEFSVKASNANVKANDEIDIMTSFIGEPQRLRTFLQGLDIKSDESLKYYALVTKGLYFEKEKNIWSMEGNGEILLDEKLLEDDIRINYNVSKELFIYNSENKILSLDIMVNGNNIKHVNIDKPGKYEMIINKNEISHLINQNELAFNLHIHVNSVYPYYVLKNAVKNKTYRSIEISYLGGNGN